MIFNIENVLSLKWMHKMNANFYRIYYFIVDDNTGFYHCTISSPPKYVFEFEDGVGMKWLRSLDEDRHIDEFVRKTKMGGVRRRLNEGRRVRGDRDDGERERDR